MNLPDDIPKPAQYGYQPTIASLYSAAAATQVRKDGLLADHYMHAFSRGKAEDPQKNPDDGWFKGVFEVYLGH